MEKLTGDPKIDFPELYEDNDYNDDSNIDEFIKQRDIENEYLKKAIADEILEYVEINKDLTISDKRLKRSLFKKIFDSIFKNVIK
jgi:hypothetical protein